MHPESLLLGIALGVCSLAACLPHYLTRRERAREEWLAEVLAARLQRWCVAR